MNKLIILLFPFLMAASSQSTVSMNVHERKQLTLTGKSAGAPASWVSSDAHVAEVVNSMSPKLNGMVFAHQPGTTTITGVDSQGAAQSVTTFKVTVTETAKATKATKK